MRKQKLTITHVFEIFKKTHAKEELLLYTTYSSIASKYFEEEKLLSFTCLSQQSHRLVSFRPAGPATDHPLAPHLPAHLSLPH